MLRQGVSGFHKWLDPGTESWHSVIFLSFLLDFSRGGSCSGQTRAMKALLACGGSWASSMYCAGVSFLCLPPSHLTAVTEQTHLNVNLNGPLQL